MLANPHLVSLKKANDKATSKNCWYNPWKREGDRADFRIVEGPLKEFLQSMFGKWFGSFPQVSATQSRNAIGIWSRSMIR